MPRNPYLISFIGAIDLDQFPNITVILVRTCHPEEDTHKKEIGDCRHVAIIVYLAMKPWRLPIPLIENQVTLPLPKIEYVEKGISNHEMR
jgi:hypothetical protein